VLGAGLRTVEISRPVNQRSWREADIAGIARNYSREGMSLLHPRIDWRGDKPGYAEMEFPALSYSMAVLYRGFGEHEVFGRAIEFVFSLIAMLAFFQLARWLVPGWGAAAAAAFFAFHPLTFEIATSLQPDGIMFACYMVAVLAFLRWQDTGSRRAYVIALAGTAGAIVAKASSAHLGLLLAALVLRKDGLPALRKPAILAFGLLALVPAVLWYHHAHKFWLDYGLSLGLSNERHFLGVRLLTEPVFLRGIVTIERVAVFTNAGLVLALLAVVLDRRARAVGLALWWLAAAMVFYLLAAGSTSQKWAYYYHVFSVPAASR
jgi:4-amino-4-deoxy-L-arabinose transferase-like glycosyltransferase